MATVFDVAAYILDKQGEITAMKLQKLVYYSQAWALVWVDRPLFPERIEAWANGPVVPELYAAHRGCYQMKAGMIAGDPSQLSEEDKEVIHPVLAFYGDKSSRWLSDLTHAEAPWRDARTGLAALERGNREITLASMYEYYSAL